METIGCCTHAVPFRRVSASKYYHNVAGTFLVVSSEHLDCGVLDEEFSFAEIRLADAFVDGDDVSQRPKVNLTRSIYEQGEQRAHELVSKHALKCNY